MKITKIQQQIKRANRYSIFIDGKYSFSLSEADLVKLKLTVGQTLDDNQLSELNDEAELSKAKNACLNLLSYRARSTGEMRDYLKRKGYDEEVSESVIEYLTSKAFLNDEDFAKQWIENRVSIKKASVRQIRSELRAKKVSSSIISKLLDDEPINEVDTIRELIEKKKSHTKYQDEEKLMQFLSRRGFSYDKILVALGRRTE